MSETTYTPGPWFTDADYPCNVSTADHRTIAETCDSYFNLEISRANARLIAAAPELVAALEAMTIDAMMGVELPLSVAVAFHDARALLARIKGESHGDS